MNTRYASLHGYHKEELLARYAAGEAELQRIELDALMFFFYSFKSVLGGGGTRPREFYSRIHVGSGDAKEPLLVWVTMGNSVTSVGHTKVSQPTALSASSPSPLSLIQSARRSTARWKVTVQACDGIGACSQLPSSLNRARPLFSARPFVAQVTVLMKAIGPDEYDDAVRRNPASCIPYAMGDTRCGRRLLADFPRDARRTVAELGSAAEDAGLIRCLTL